MRSLRWCSQFALGLLCFNALLTQGAAAYTAEYCSTLNTASTAKNSSIYQSNGLCHDFCVQSYAFAVVQDDGCWCSNYAPGTTTSGCDHKCPGFPFEMCGGDNAYGYIALNIAPKGTQGASSATPASSSTSSSSQIAIQVTVTATATPPAVTIVATPTTSSSESSTSSSSSSSSSSSTTTTSSLTTSSQSSSSSSTWTPTPIISLETVTGQVRTVTVTPTVPPTAGSASGMTGSSKKKSGLGVGAAVGLTIGLVALVAIIGTIAFCCVKRHRQATADEFNSASRRGSSAGLGMASTGGFGPSRTMSQSSRFILNTDGRQVVETWEPGDHTPGTRSSRLMPVDPRLDPFAAVYQRGENKSRESINTIRDDHDYSRRVAGPGPILRATNPDLPES